MKDLIEQIETQSSLGQESEQFSGFDWESTVYQQAPLSSE
jgi:hypothetical protein